ncbi:muts domain V-domain-containing protein [Protomyces lactucae-debilis]|uniref:Muts domain V-domain-containing protein n=1 Tax=Protomyces lactucae-debilis TaxID=2754530 RepID=A0A1Y2F4C5_PROLT|nr:muts domain V-domain-containing protein [Protomyces lactucae-debilis]ORY78537.1 muts domain V-domain-containing protein [Protomyces lactucae-debilis]
MEYDSHSAPAASQASEDDFGNVLEPVIASFDYKDKKLGIAFYAREQATLFIAQDIQHEAPPCFDAMKRARFQIEPDVILLSSRADDAFHSTEVNDLVLSDADETRKQVRPSPEFSSISAMGRSCELRAAKDAVHAHIAPRITFGTSLTDSESHHRLAGIKLGGSIDDSAILSLGCANAVLCYIEKHCATLHGDEELSTYVHQVTMYAPKNHLTISPDSLFALGIFGDEAHPNVHANGSKESLTLFGVLNTCRTAQGKILLRSWFAQPAMDLVTLNERHDAVACLLMPANQHLLGSIASCLRSCADMRKVLALLRQGRFHHGLSSSMRVATEWQRILQFSFNLCKIRSNLKDLLSGQHAVLLDQIVAACRIADLNAVGSLINDVVDFDASQTEQRVVVQRGIDDELDQLKETYDSLDGVLNQERQRLSVAVPQAYSASVQCVYLPQIGFLTAMPASGAPTTSGKNSITSTMRLEAPVVPVWQDDSWIMSFSTAENVYFKTQRMTELDEYYGDVHTLVADREIELLYQLSVRVLKHSELLVTLSDLVASLDCLVAFAEAAKKHKYCRPEMVEASVLDVKGGRHPLHEIILATFVENDTLLRGGPSDDQMDAINAILLTGANYSGKSVYLKQTALIVYMAHIGCFVPASSAVIGLTDKILTRISTRETVAKPSSAFLLDLQQVALMTSTMTSRSLLIIDEFGKGTESTDGAALFGALVELLTGQLADHQDTRPRTLIATHFHEVIELGFMKQPPNLKLQHMQIHIPDAGDGVQNAGEANIDTKLTYLYRLADGPSHGSFGLNCAMIGGVQPDVLARAAQLLAVTSRGESLVHAMTELTEDEKEDLRRAEKLARAFLSWDLTAEPVEGIKGRLQSLLTL